VRFSTYSIKVMHEKLGWIVWCFENKPQCFENEDLALSGQFPTFVNVYHVNLTKKAIKAFLNMIVFVMRDGNYLVCTFSRSPTTLKQP
jgi:hypothetical protein